MDLIHTYTPFYFRSFLNIHTSTDLLFSFLSFPFLSGGGKYDAHAPAFPFPHPCPSSSFPTHTYNATHAKLAFSIRKGKEKKPPTFLFGCSCSSDVLSVQDFYCSSYILISLMDNTIRGQRSTSFPLEHVEKYASSPVSFLSCGIRG